jgi:hypothetical protein
MAPLKPKRSACTKKERAPRTPSLVRIPSPISIVVDGITATQTQSTIIDDAQEPQPLLPNPHNNRNAPLTLRLVSLNVPYNKITGKPEKQANSKPTNTDNNEITINDESLLPVLVPPGLAVLPAKVPPVLAISDRTCQIKKLAI